MIYAVTHGHRAAGFNPPNTEEGLEQISRTNELLHQMYSHSGRKIGLIVQGTGVRFQQIATFIKHSFILHLTPGIKVLTTVLLGGEESFDDTKGIVHLSGRETDAKHFVGLEKFMSAAQCWSYLAGMEAKAKKYGDVILCTGRAFFKVLRFESKSASLYQLDTKQKIITKIMEGGILCEEE